MKVDNIFLLFENSGKYFNSYNEAYYNTKKPGTSKIVYYVFTPTMQRFKRVSEIEKCCRDYFKHITGFEYFDIISQKGSNQMKLFKEI